jgi:hypothetical protein
MRHDDARLFARAFIGNFGVDCLDRFDSIKDELGLEVKEVDADAFDGSLIRVSNYPKGVILLNKNIREMGRRRFTLAHEIAHYVIPGHGKEAGYCRRKDIESWSLGLTAKERQANTFAAEILMPLSLVTDAVDEDPSFEIVEEISARCRSSLTASAYRLVELTSHRLALVWSEGGRVIWYKGSSEFDQQIRCEDCSPETLASALFLGQEVPDDFDLVPANAWIYDRNLRDGAKILEHSRSLPRYNAVITLLLIPGIIESQSKFGDSWE